MALYHKYRPQTFDDLVGQDHIREILSNALRQDKVSHAYLFSGPRGLGKTTTARLLAKAINCANNQKDKTKPCNACDICRQISASQALDVIEIDGASNRGIDEIRELRDKVRFAPNFAPKKIYIIDEVHMLTAPAFNALLKTLEEPPFHAIFILATTEAHKVPETILSRVQRFDFRRAAEKDLQEYLTKIAQAEKVEIEPAAIGEITRLAQGSFRDGIMFLDQAISGAPKKINLDWVLKSLGMASGKTVDSFIARLEKQDTAKCLIILDKMKDGGLDLSNFVDLLITQMRKRMRLNGKDLDWARWIKILLKASKQISYAPDPCLPLELAIYDMSQNLDDNFKRSNVDKKEPIYEKVSFKVNPVRNSSGALNPVGIILKSDPAAEQRGIISNGVKKKSDSKDPKPEKEKKSSKTDSLLIDDIHSQWGKILSELKASNFSLSNLLAGAMIEGLDGNVLRISVKYQFYKDQLEKVGSRKIVEKICLQILGLPIILDCKVDKGMFLAQEKKKDSELQRQVSELLA
ncbi:MAG: DNA polymerase III subunit gamma/tau [Candidatus Berkelbacteria bacterium Licking1014_7]|uniref:DNA polymerase III subunit gamma/tau n=1 Tax=Candidatus Berkelbacteria bacterium Licking1014_7 TaxID=2017147 RepID=A0A554LI62_9BACT|nr:MAG: DNA polymerase III subunit gamma/tau [Candidatus Berkelbacteria bacterium Licking1014_7]